MTIRRMTPQAGCFGPKQTREAAAESPEATAAVCPTGPGAAWCRIPIVMPTEDKTMAADDTKPALEDLLEDLPEHGLPLTEEDREWLEAPAVAERCSDHP
jgi:hypothetical protein